MKTLSARLAGGLARFAVPHLQPHGARPPARLDPRELATISGGIDWSSIRRSLKPYLPPHGPTIPLGPFTPPKPTDPRIA